MNAPHCYVQDGQTALYIASHEGHRAVVKQLLITQHMNINISKV